MLEIAAIKTTPQSSEAQSQNGKKPVSSSDSDENAQEFQTEYEATAKDADRASERPSTDSNSSAKNDEASEPVRDKTAEAVASEEEPIVEIAAGETGLAVSDTIKKPTALTSKPELTSGRPEISKSDPEKPLTEQPVARVKPAAAPGNDVDTAQVMTDDAPKTIPAKSTAETVFISKTSPDMRDMKHADASKTADAKVQTLGGTSENGMVPAPGAQKEASKLVVPQDLRSTKSEDIRLRRTEVHFEAPKATTSAPATTPVAKPPVAPVQTLTKVELSKEKPDLISMVSGDTETFALYESRTGSATQSTNALSQVLNRTDTPTMIARQMADALQRAQDRPVEISLNPKELGRVRMNISAAEVGITVSVVAERPETLDLMRRNIEQLAREFQSIGYEDINFAFSQGESNSGFSDDETSGSDTTATHLDLTSEEELQPVHPQTVTTTGVDIRL